MAVDNVTEILRIPFFEVFNITVTEFLNVLSYISYKNKKIEKEINKK